MKKTIIFVSILVVALVGAGYYFMSGHANESSQSVFTGDGSVNRKFFVYDDSKLTDERLVEQQREEGLYVEFGARAESDDANGTIINHYRDLLNQDDWSIERTLTDGADARIDATKEKGDYEYTISILANEQEDALTSIRYSLLTNELDE